MSTITKLDPNVRLDRYLRKQMRRDLAKDAKTAAELVRRGQKGLDIAREHPAAPAVLFKHEQLLRDMTVRSAVLQMTLKHVTKICLDPRRSGATKEAILAKLGMGPT